jgi:hypothetical protein
VRISSRHHSKVHTGGIVRDPKCTKPQARAPRLRRTIVDADPFSVWDARVKIGNVRLTVLVCQILMLSTYASVLGERHLKVRYVATNHSTAASLC